MGIKLKHSSPVHPGVVLASGDTQWNSRDDTSKAQNAFLNWGILSNISLLVNKYSLNWRTVNTELVNSASFSYW